MQIGGNGVTTTNMYSLSCGHLLAMKAERVMSSTTIVLFGNVFLRIQHKYAIVTSFLINIKKH
jgi:hypothetical protein